jgi:hypothetical protein
MAQVREAEAYHTASVMHDAIFEADRLCSAIYRAVTDAYLTRLREDQADPEVRSAAEKASSPEVRDQAAEALRCLYAAHNHLQNLTNYEPPF